jgi:6-phosphofructokinase 1
MGRNCGYLALMSGILGGAEIVITPERATTMEQVSAALEDSYVRGKTHAVAVIAEGAPFSTNELADYLNSQHLGFEIRLTILGHIQRGGSPTAFDRLLATRMGVKAVEALKEGQSGVMVGLSGRDMKTVSLEDVTTKTRQVNEGYYEMARILSR